MRTRPPGVGETLLVGGLLAVYCGCTVTAWALGVVERVMPHEAP